MTHDRTVARAIQVGIVAPAVLVAVGVALQIASRDQLPARVVTHWGPQGPDGFDSPWTFTFLTLVAGLGIPALMTVFSIPAMRRGERSPMLRLMPAIGLGFAALIVTLSTGSLLVQRGMDEGSAPGIGPIVIASYAAAILAGLVGWAAQPRQELIQPSERRVDPLIVAPGERVAWVGRAEAGGGLLAILVGAALALSAGAVWMWIAGDPGPALILTGVAALIAVLAGATTSFTVRADLSGLVVRSHVGIPRFRVPAADIAEVSVIDVSGLAQFGGWGVRVVPGATGIVLRNGSALQVTRRGGRRLVVTIDDAATIAAVLAAASEAGSHADQD
ncbi:DUF1648 domain-containing protein [Demequina capsici]|uniref:DUF1648 domain-containing protein n=1 Tax=Demequina capsici TaxID=3075620 RepID=A0AA96F7H3_9MICO|nr:DUF1648 domain-containing protein [Demequina sp. OYTSA14]WNM25014.1 DUF1648 domain-containing protein [Demequina sp. OYTSA14]